MGGTTFDWLGRPGVAFGVGAAAAAAILAWALRSPARGDRDDPPEEPGRLARRLAIRAAIGLAAVLGGAAAAVSGRVPAALPLLAAGFGLWVRLIRGNARHRHAGPAVRRVVDLADAALHTSLVGGVLVVGNLLAFQYGSRPLDLTRERSFSLSGLTLGQLRALERPLTLTVFHGRTEAARLQLDRVRQLLELYRAAAPGRVRLAYLDQYAEPEAFEALARRAPGVAVAPDGGVVVEYGEGDDARAQVVRNAGMFAPTPGDSDGDPARFATDFAGEDAITSAILRLREGVRRRVGFTANHGEASGVVEPGRPSTSLLRARLASVGIEPVDIDLGRGPIPEDVDALAVIAPRTPFRPEEVERLRRELAAGRPLLVVADGSEPTGLEPLLREYRVEFGPGLVVDPVSNYNRRASVVVVPTGPSPPHPIVAPLANRFVILAEASPLVIAPSAAGGEWMVQALLATGPESWAEANPGRRPLAFDAEEDRPGPVPVGVAVSGREAPDGGDPEPRLVAISGRFAADDSFVELAPANLDLVVNALNWLRGQPDRIGIAPRTHVALTLAVDPALRSRLVLVPTVLASLVIVGLGLGTYLARRA